MRAADGVPIELSHRDDPEIDIQVPDHLLCVNFKPMYRSVYTYAGAGEARGTRHLGSSHIVAADHNIRAYTPNATDRWATGLSPHRYVLDRRVTFVRERLFGP